MRIEGDRIVDVSAEDAKDLRAYVAAVPHDMDAGSASAKTYDLWHRWQLFRPGLKLHDARIAFLSMAALALADAPKASPAVTEKPYSGILDGLTTLQKSKAVVTPTFALKMLYEPLWSILGAKWPDRGEYQVDYHKSADYPVRTEEVPYLAWAIERLLSSEQATITYTCDGSGVTIAMKRGNLVRVVEGDLETHAWDLARPELGDLYAVRLPKKQPASVAKPSSVPSKYTFKNGRDLWNRLGEAHALNAHYYVRAQKFDSLLKACEFFWTLVHTRPNESHYLCATKDDKIVASHTDGRTRVIVEENALIPAEVCA
jgi:hypothetical protein